MRLYFYGQSEDKATSVKSQQILEILQNTDIQLHSNFLPDELSNNNVNSLYTQTGLSVFDQFNAFILEVTKTDQQINYFLAQALLQKKSVLCLYQKNIPPRSLIMFLKQKHLSNKVLIKAYTEASLKKTLLDFLRSIESGVEELEVPNIRFTLRLTPKLDKYLNFVVQGKKVTRANYIRQLIKNNMDNNKKFNQRKKLD